MPNCDELLIREFELQTKLERILPGVADAIIQHELSALLGDRSPAAYAAGLTALAQRRHDLAQLNDFAWENLAHVVIQISYFQQILTYARAQQLLAKAEITYCQIIGDYFQRHLALRIEIGGNKSGFHIHAHVLAEAGDYEAFKIRTKFARQGDEKFLRSRRAPRRRLRQSEQDYHQRLYNYNTKFATLLSWQNGCKTRTCLPAPTAIIHYPGLFFRTQNSPFQILARQPIPIPERDRRRVVRARMYEILQQRKNTLHSQKNSTFRRPGFSLYSEAEAGVLGHGPYKPTWIKSRALEFSG